MATTHYVIGSAVGPAPYPALVRDLQRVIGDEARAQIARRPGAPARPRDRLRGRRLQRHRHVRAFVGDDGVELIGVEAAGEGLDTLRHSAPLTTGAAACCTARCRPCSRTRRARSSRRTRCPPGSTIRASGPEHAYLRDSGRVRYVAVADEDALAAFTRVAQLEGILPALEPAHAIAWLLANPAPGAVARHALGARRQGPGGGARRVSVRTRPPGVDRIASAFAGHGKRAALMPYLMGGFPDVESSLAAGEAAAAARAPT